MDILAIGFQMALGVGIVCEDPDFPIWGEQFQRGIFGDCNNVSLAWSSSFYENFGQNRP